MKVPKQDSDVSAKVDCFWHRGGVAPPSHLRLPLYHFPPIFCKKNGQPFFGFSTRTLYQLMGNEF